MLNVPPTEESSQKIAATIQSVKETLRSIPDRGFSYGLIRYLAKETEQNGAIKHHPKIDIAFNYLGRFQGMQEKDSFFTFAEIPAPSEQVGNGADAAAGGILTHSLSIICQHAGDGLQISFSYDSDVFADELMKGWGEQWCDFMKEVVVCCEAAASQGSLTPSDVPLVRSPAVLQEIQQTHLPLLNLNPVDVEDIYPVTPLQSGLLLAMMRDQSEYTVQIAYEIAGTFEIERFKRAWHLVAEHHGILRTAFVSTSAGLYQVVHRSVDIDWSDVIWEGEEVESEYASFLREDRSRGFTLQSKSMMRFTVAKIKDTDRYRIIWTNHHSILDGWSLPIIFGDVITAYLGHSVEPRPDFSRYITYIESAKQEECALFWKQAFDGVPSSSPLPFGRPLSEPLTDKIQTFSHTVDFPASMLLGYAQQLRVTVNTILRAAWALVMRHYSRQDTVVFGSVVSGREVPLEEIDRMVGMLINTIGIPVKMREEMLLEELIRDLHAFHVDSLPFSHSSLVDVQRWAGQSSADKLFHSIVVFENYPTPSGEGTLPFTVKPVGGKEAVDTALGMSLAVVENKLMKTVSFDSSVYYKDHVHRVSDTFDKILMRIISTEAQKLTVGELNSVFNDELNILRRLHNGPSKKFAHECLHEAFRQQVRSNPSGIAVKHGERWTSYQALDVASDKVAARLRSCGVTRGSMIPVVVRRSTEMLAGFLGVLKANCAYVPIEACAPKDRIRAIINDVQSSPAVVLTTNTCRESLEGVVDGHIICIDELEHAQDASNAKVRESYSGDDLAYVIFTSGSTGKPKGVRVAHRSAMNAIQAAAQDMGLRRGVHVSQVLAINFDAAIMEYLGGLCTGATVVLSGDDPLESLRIVECLVITAAGLAKLKREDLPKVRSITVGGEACPRQVADYWAQHAVLNIGYGPTECSIQSHLSRYRTRERMTVGRPIANTSCYILDTHGKFVPIGVPGELCIGGTGVSLGYLNMPEQTKAAFVDDPERPGFKMYKTGDLARWTLDGKVEILGRMDDQIKVRGYRVELDEIVAVAMQCEGVRIAAVIVKEGDLACFVSPSSVSTRDLRQHMSQFLPSYMVPAAILSLDELPLTSNGKVDKRSLAEIDIAVEIDLPASPIEKMLAKVWAGVLNSDVSRIGVHQSFFELGGDSITAARVVACVQREGYDLSVGALFKTPTIAQLAPTLQQIESEMVNEEAPLVRAEVLEKIKGDSLSTLGLSMGDVEDIYPATPLQAGLLAIMMKNPEAYAVQHVWELEGEVDMDVLRRALLQLTQQHPILRTTFAVVDGSFYQIVRKLATDVWEETLDWQGADAEEKMVDFLKRDSKRGFRVSDVSLMRIAVGKVSPRTYRLILTMHHSLFDGWSMSILIGDFLNVYHGAYADPRPSLRPFVGALLSRNETSTKEFWQSCLKDVVPAQTLSGTTAHAVASPSRLTHSVTLTTSMAELNKLTRATGWTVANFLYVTWAIVLREFLRTDDITFGTVLSGRDLPVPDIDRLVGMLMSTVPIRLAMKRDISVRQLLDNAKYLYADILPHSQASLLDIKGFSGLSAHEELFRTLLVYENLLVADTTSTSSSKPAFDLRILPSGGQANDYEMEVVVSPSASTLDASFMYDAGVLDNDHVYNIASQFQYVFSALLQCADFEAPLSMLFGLDPRQEQLLNQWQSGPSVPISKQCAHEVFEQFVLEQPYAIAVESQEAKITITYQELDHRANMVANELRKLGVRPGAQVACVISRSVEMVVGILGVLKAGAAYVPVDFSVPEQRIKSIFEDISCEVVLATAKTVDAVPESHKARVRLIDDFMREDLSRVARSAWTKPKELATNNDLAYIIFTSG
ncbi:hypothetical protein HK102_004218, partial [Quaeritorhiza haematococci]